MHCACLRPLLPDIRSWSTPEPANTAKPAHGKASSILSLQPSELESHSDYHCAKENKILSRTALCSDKKQGVVSLKRNISGQCITPTMPVPSVLLSPRFVCLLVRNHPAEVRGTFSFSKD